MPHSDVVPSISQLWPPEQHISPGSSSLHSSGLLPHRARGAKVGPHYGSRYIVGWSWKTGQSPGWSQSAYSALFGEQGNMYVNFTSGVQVSHSAPQPRQSYWSLSQQQDSSSWYGTQSLAYPICGWNHLLPRKYLQACVISPSCVPSQGCRS